MNISIIGAGNGGQAMAGHFALLGHNVKLYNRNLDNIKPILSSGEIALNDKIVGVGKLRIVTDDLQEAISNSEIIMVVTVATAHRELASKMAPFLKDGQTIVLNPGRTLGALEFYNEINKYTNTRVYIAEAQSLIYACRADSPGNVRIIGIKVRVPLAAFPTEDTDYVLEKVNKVFPCFIKAKNILHTSLENIGAILHPAVIIFNTAAIERGNLFYFYNDMTASVANFLEKIDQERLAIGQSLGIELLSLYDWVSYAYNDIEGESLLEKMRNNPAYFKIKSPSALESRLLFEDIPTGLLPMTEIAKLVKVRTPLMSSIIEIMQSLLGVNFYSCGRTLSNLGIHNISELMDLNN